MSPTIGISSTYLLRLCKYCLNVQPEILPCDIFKAKSQLVDNSSFIVNIQKSNLPGSHFVCILIKPEEIYYFDSLGFPIVNSYIDTKLKSVKKPVHYTSKPVQGEKSVFCAFYCLAFLIMCQDRGKTFEEFLKMFSYGYSDSYMKNEEKCTNIIKSSLTLS